MGMKKKVLIFSLNYYPRFIGGAEVAVKEITDRIDTKDIEFHMVTLRFDSDLPEVEQIGNVLVHRIGFAKKGATIADLRKFPLHLNKHWYQLAAAGKAEALHKKYRYDGVWAMMAHSCGIPAGIFKSRHPDVKYLLTLQEGDPPETIERLMKPVAPLFVQAFTKADALQTISTFLLSWGKRMGFAGTGVVVPNAVNTKKFAHVYASDEIEAMKHSLGKKEGDVYMVTTSRLVHKNAVDDVIMALTHLPSNVSFLIYGIGPDEEKLKAQAKVLGVEKRARFMGEIGHDAMPLMLAACDIFIRPSRSEGMGNSFVEAMAAGLPVIATQEGGLSDFIFDAKRNPDIPTTAWAVDKDSPEQIAEAVERIVAHPEDTARVVETAKKLAFQKYDWSLIAADMQRLFTKMFSGKVE
jgi:glycosyltransferase involved in cell wall biosynthesis